MTDKQTSPKVRLVQIGEESEGQRVDNFLLKTMKGVPKTRIYRCIRKGEVRVNGKRVQASRKLILADEVRIPPVRMAADRPVHLGDGFRNNLEQATLVENDALIVINKPTGMAVHGGSGVSLGVIEAMRQMRPDCRYLELVHRLDRETSGCLMIAKKPSYLKALQQLLQNKDELGKHYICLVHGKWSKRKQIVNLPLSKNVLASGERVSRVQQDGKRSITEFDVLQQSGQLSLLAVRPVTGRTHQIRVHCAASGHPIVGDTKYGRESTDKQLGSGALRLMLHAERLEIPALLNWPALTVEAPVDKRFTNLQSLIKSI